MPIITRKQYMDNSSELHHAYYSQFVTPETEKYVLKSVGLKKLLRSKDGHFNDLGIRHSLNGAGTWVWDFAPYNLQAMRDAGEVTRGYLPSHSSVTCTAKAAARSIVERERGAA